MLPDEEDEYDLPVDQMDGMPDGADAFANVGQGLVGEHKTEMLQYWQRIIDDIERISDDGMDSDVFKSTVLPLARIKKVMKTDSEVRMISAEAPILFAKGCDIFITELTMRAWIHAEENKRRTLQRSDIATAIQRSDVFDFLIDIVPREEAQPRRTSQRLPEFQHPEPPRQETMQNPGLMGQMPPNQMMLQGQLPGQISGQISGQLPGQMPGQMLQNQMQTMPGQMPPQMQGQLPPQMQGQLQGQQQLSGQMPNQMQGQMQGQMMAMPGPDQKQEGGAPPHLAGQMMNMPSNMPQSLGGQGPSQSMANLGTLSNVAMNNLDLAAMNMSNLQMPYDGSMAMPGQGNLGGFNGAPNQSPDQGNQQQDEAPNAEEEGQGSPANAGNDGEEDDEDEEAPRSPEGGSESSSAHPAKKQKLGGQPETLKMEPKDDSNFPGSPRYESTELQFSPSYQPDGVDVGAYQEF